MQTIKTQPGEIQYKNMADAFVKILQHEGPKALFKGGMYLLESLDVGIILAACRMMVIAPLFGIAQTVYYIGVAEKVLGIQKSAHV